MWSYCPSMYRCLPLVLLLSVVACDASKPANSSKASVKSESKGETKKEEPDAFSSYQRKSMASEA